MSEYDELTVAIQLTDPTYRFMRHYDSTIRSLRPTFKSKSIDPNNYESLELIGEGLTLLIEIVDSNRIDEIPRYMVYNILLFARLAIRYYGKSHLYKPIAKQIDIIEEKYQNLQERPAIQDKLVRKK